MGRADRRQRWEASLYTATCERLRKGMHRLIVVDIDGIERVRVDVPTPRRADDFDAALERTGFVPIDGQWSLGSSEITCGPRYELVRASDAWDVLVTAAPVDDRILLDADDNIELSADDALELAGALQTAVMVVTGTATLRGDGTLSLASQQ